MFVSRSLDYALRCLIVLAAREHTASLRELADSARVPRSYLAKVMRTLVVAGLVRSDAGSHGGYRLVRAPRDISLKEIYESVEGSFRTLVCGHGEDDCSLRDDCGQVPVWSSLEAEIVGLLDRRTLADFTPERPNAPVFPVDRIRA